MWWTPAIPVKSSSFFTNAPRRGHPYRGQRTNRPDGGDAGLRRRIAADRGGRREADRARGETAGLFRDGLTASVRPPAGSGVCSIAMPPNIIAILWDFDKTLIPGYMQAPLFEHYGVDAVRFWDEVNALPEFHRKDGESEPFISDSLYLNHILAYVRQGVFAGLNNAMLRRLGAKLNLAAGVPGIFEDIGRFTREHPAFRDGRIGIEHYVISTGLRQMVLGSAVGPYMRQIWGCE